MVEEPKWRKGYRLVSLKTGLEVLIGETVKDFRGDTMTVIDFMAPLHEPSTGRVVLKHEDGWEHAYYPSVIDTQVVQKAEA